MGAALAAAALAPGPAHAAGVPRFVQEGGAPIAIPDAYRVVAGDFSKPTDGRPDLAVITKTVGGPGGILPFQRKSTGGFVRDEEPGPALSGGGYIPATADFNKDGPGD